MGRWQLFCLLPTNAALEPCPPRKPGPEPSSCLPEPSEVSAASPAQMSSGFAVRPPRVSRAQASNTPALVFGNPTSPCFLHRPSLRSPCLWSPAGVGAPFTPHRRGLDVEGHRVSASTGYANRFLLGARAWKLNGVRRGYCLTAAVLALLSRNLVLGQP